MNEALAVLLVEDDPVQCEAFTQYTASIDNIELIGITNNSETALQYVKHYLPDAVILDLELNRGSGNGLFFLKELRELNLTKYPYILITTNNMSEITYEQARALGAGFIMSKYQNDYSVNRVIDFLVIMKETLHNSRVSLKASTTSSVVPDGLNTLGVIKRIDRELDLIGISPKAIGRKYLVDAIQLIMMQQSSQICVHLAKRYAKSDASIERAMQNAINKAWRTSCIDDLCCYYTAKISSDKGVPTLMEFIYYYAHKIKEDIPTR
ncbi:MAG: sporulation initiation factor Spo0A C-terminal domain-containing protein [Mobilitalea sp.]